MTAPNYYAQRIDVMSRCLSRRNETRDPRIGTLRIIDTSSSLPEGVIDNAEDYIVSMNEANARLKAIDSVTDRIRDFLGERGVERLEKLMLLEDGWDCGRGEAFSRLSLALLDYFLVLFKTREDKPRSVFLTPEGNIELQWEDEKGNDIVVEFAGEKFEYYFESAGDEGMFPWKDAKSLISRIEEIERSNESNERMRE